MLTVTLLNFTRQLAMDEVIWSKTNRHVQKQTISTPALNLSAGKASNVNPQKLQFPLAICFY